MTTARARRRIEPLPFIRVTPATRPTFFSDLNASHESFPRLAAERIARLEDLANVDQVLADVPRDWYRMVETLALQAIAIRIAKIQPMHKSAAAIAAAREQRRGELAKIPEDLRGRVEAWVRSYYVTRPWLYRDGKPVSGGDA